LPIFTFRYAATSFQGPAREKDETPVEAGRRDMRSAASQVAVPSARMRQNGRVRGEAGAQRRARAPQVVAEACAVVQIIFLPSYGSDGSTRFMIPVPVLSLPSTLSPSKENGVRHDALPGRGVSVCVLSAHACVRRSHVARALNAPRWRGVFSRKPVRRYNHAPKEFMKVARASIGAAFIRSPPAIGAVYLRGGRVMLMRRPPSDMNAVLEERFRRTCCTRDKRAAGAASLLLPVAPRR